MTMFYLGFGLQLPDQANRCRLKKFGKFLTSKFSMRNDLRIDATFFF